MFRSTKTFLAPSFTLLLCLCSPSKALPRVVPDRVLVRLPVEAPGASGVSNMSSARVSRAQPGAKIVKSFPYVGWQVVELPKGSGEAGRRALQQQLGVEVVPDYIRSINKVPNDTHWSNQWNMRQIKAPGAWDTRTHANGTVVAVLDSGVAQYHPDIVQNLWINTLEIPGNGLDDDRNGYIDDVNGISAPRGDGNIFDDNGHGSHIAGIIGGFGNNGRGVTGVSWMVKIMALKFLNVNGDGSDSNAIECLNYVIAMKNRGVNVRVTNSSWGGQEDNPALKEAYERAGAAGILNICSSGNGGSDFRGDNNDLTPDYPSTYPLANIVSVGSSNLSDNPSFFSNYGPTSVDLAAPGEAIYSIQPMNGPAAAPSGYGYLSGTSMAAPHVAAAAALVWGLNPSMTAAQVKSRLLASVETVPAWQGKSVTGGRLNLYRAVTGSIYKISGQVTGTPAGGASTPLGAAKILLNGNLKTMADQNGNYVIPALPAGRYQVTAQVNGYSFPMRTLNLPQGPLIPGTPHASVPLAGTATAPSYYDIRGTARDLANQPVAGVEIHYAAMPDAPLTATDANGNYVVRSRLPGTYRLIAKSPGQQWLPSATTVTTPASNGTPDQHGICNFSLRPTDSSPPSITVSAPLGGSTYNSAPPSATGTATDTTGLANLFFVLQKNSDGVLNWYNWNSGTWTSNSADAGTIRTIQASGTTFPWSQALPAQSPAQYTLLIWGRDTLGNEPPVNGETSVNWTIGN